MADARSMLYDMVSSVGSEMSLESGVVDDIQSIAVSAVLEDFVEASSGGEMNAFGAAVVVAGIQFLW